VKSLREHLNVEIARESVSENRRVRVRLPADMERDALRDLKLKLEKLDLIARTSRATKHHIDFSVADPDLFEEFIERVLPGSTVEIV